MYREIDTLEYAQIRLNGWERCRHFGINPDRYLSKESLDKLTCVVHGAVDVLRIDNDRIEIGKQCQ